MTNTITLPRINSNLLALTSFILICMMMFLTVQPTLAWHCGGYIALMNLQAEEINRLTDLQLIPLNGICNILDLPEISHPSEFNVPEDTEYPDDPDVREALLTLFQTAINISNNITDAYKVLLSLVTDYELCLNEHNTEGNDNLYCVSGGCVSGGCDNT